MGEINARLIAGDLENEGIRTHIELEGSAWFYAAEDPNRMATIYVLAHDVDRAGSVLEEASSGNAEILDEDYHEVADVPEPSYEVVAEQDRGLRSRPLRWAIAAAVVGALLFGFLEGSFRDLLR